jgi:hypothetical protein
VGLRAGLDDMEKRKFLTLPGLELRPLGRPASRQSLYRLRYSGSYGIQCSIEKYVLAVKAVRFCDDNANTNFGGALRRRETNDIAELWCLCHVKWV